MELNLIDRLHVICWTPPDYWQTDNSNGPVMVIRNYHWLTTINCLRELINTYRGIDHFADIMSSLLVGM